MQSYTEKLLQSLSGHASFVPLGDKLAQGRNHVDTQYTWTKKKCRTSWLEDKTENGCHTVMYSIADTSIARL